MILEKNKELASLASRNREIQSEFEANHKKIRRIVISEIRRAMTTYGISFDDLNAKDKKEGAKKTARKFTVKPKYKSPDGKNTWTGRGRTPKWLTKELSEGKKLEDFLIARAS